MTFRIHLSIVLCFFLLQIADGQSTRNEQINLKPETETVNGVKFNMIKVDGGTFDMGGTNDLNNNEKPIHKVEVSTFYIGTCEVTQDLYKAVMGTNPSVFNTCGNCPVESVSWKDAQEFLIKLNKLTGKKYRLPSEAEWEFAARGGVLSKKTEYPGSDSINDVGWIWNEEDDGPKSIHPVAQKQPNELGIYDMAGNVWEWCQDFYGADYYAQSPGLDPKGPAKGPFRVIRGGAWVKVAFYARVANRNDAVPSGSFDSIGFRIARTQ